MADGVLITEEPLYELLVDDGGPRGGCGFVVEIASGDARDAHRIEIAGGRHIEIDDPVSGRSRSALHLKAIAAMTAGERHSIATGRRDHAGKADYVLADRGE